MPMIQFIIKLNNNETTASCKGYYEVFVYYSSLPRPE